MMNFAYFLLIFDCSFFRGGDVSKIATLIWRTFLFHLDRLVAFLLNFVLFLPLCVCAILLSLFVILTSVGVVGRAVGDVIYNRQVRFHWGLRLA